MKTEFTVEYLSEEELIKPKVLQTPIAVRVTIEGKVELVDALVALIKTRYNMVH